MVKFETLRSYMEFEASGDSKCVLVTVEGDGADGSFIDQFHLTKADVLSLMELFSRWARV